MAMMDPDDQRRIELVFAAGAARFSMLAFTARRAAESLLSLHDAALLASPEAVAAAEAAALAIARARRTED